MNDKQAQSLGFTDAKEFYRYKFQEEQDNERLRFDGDGTDGPYYD